MSRQREVRTAYAISRELDLTLDRWMMPSIILEARVDGLFWRMLWNPPKMSDDVRWELEGKASICEYELLLHADVIVHMECDEALWDEHQKGEIQQWMKTPAWKFEHDRYRYDVNDNSRIVDTFYLNELPEYEF